MRDHTHDRMRLIVNSALGYKYKYYPNYHSMIKTLALSSNHQLRN